MTNGEITLLENAMKRRITALPSRLRLFTSEKTDLPRALIITGPRGCGKSTFLLHHAAKRKMLYVSVDNPVIVSQSLYQIVSDIFMLGYEGVILDEVHFAANWSLHLKALYDDFPDKSIWASDSSSLVLRAGNADLSRRFIPITMPLMSFREFLFLQTGKEYDIYRLGSNELPVLPDTNLLSMFRDYRRFGTRPFYQDGNFDTRYMGILDKVLNNDIPFFLPSITDNNLRLMRAIIGTLATSSIPRIQVTSLCNDWRVSADKLYQLLFIMESIGLLRVVRIENDKKARSVGAKMLFADPCAYGVLHADMGTEREAFVVNCFAQSGYTVEAKKNEKEGDFLISHQSFGNIPNKQITIEVGGANKKRKKADFVVRDNIDYPTSDSIPFWLLGMMW